MVVRTFAVKVTLFNVTGQLKLSGQLNLGLKNVSSRYAENTGYHFIKRMQAGIQG